MASAYELLTLDGLVLNDGVTFDLEAVDLTPPPELEEWIKGADSNGALLAREPLCDNRTITATLRIVQQATMDLALAKISQIVDKIKECQRNANGLALAWTPHDATLPAITFRCLSGQITGLPIDVTAGWLVNAPTVQIKLTCLPFGEGAEVGDLVDDFSTNTIANYTLTGSGSFSISGGVLVPSSTAAKILTHTSLPYLFTNAWVTTKFTIGASAASGTFGVNVRYLDASNYIRVDVACAGASSTLRIAKGDVGVETNLATASCSISAATSYWLRARAEGNVLTAELYTAAPTPASTPTATCTATLAGANATKFGSGIAGRTSIVMAPQATDWRADDFTVNPNITKTTDPIVTLELANIAGDVPALGRLVVTDGASQARRYIPWGLESRWYPTSSPPSLILDSSSMITSGFAGATGTVSGAYSGASNNVIVTTLRPQLQALCGFGILTHVGTFRPQLRCYVASPTTTALRLTYQALEGPFRSLSFKVPVVTGFNHIDLGEITIPQAVLGAQKWTGQIEAYSTGSGGELLSVDAVWLMPAEQYGRAVATYAYAPGLQVARDDFGSRTAGVALGGTSMQAGAGTWATSGSTTDFAAADAPAATDETMARSTVSDTGFRYAIAGSATPSDIEVGIDAIRTVDAITQHLLIARWTDSTHYLSFALYHFDHPAASTQWQINCWNGTIGANVASGITSWVPLNSVVSMRMVVYASGAGHAWVLLNGTQIAQMDFADPLLATGGALATGKSGFGDANVTSEANTRYYDNFYTATPAPEPVCCYSGQSIEFRHNTTLREDSTGTYAGPPPAYVGGRFFPPNAGGADRKVRVAAIARRNNVESMPDNNIADSTTMQAYVTPRWLVVPGAP